MSRTQSSPDGFKDIKDLIARVSTLERQVRVLSVVDVSGLPVSQWPASAGQRVSYLADYAKGTRWEFVYNPSAPSAFKWEAVGAAPMRTSWAGGGTTITAGGAYTEAAIPYFGITLPLAGDYTFTSIISGFALGANNADFRIYPKASSGSTLGDSAWITVIPASAGGAFTFPGLRDFTSVGVGALVQLMYMGSQSSYQFSAYNAFLQATPTRVG